MIKEKDNKYKPLVIVIMITIMGSFLSGINYLSTKNFIVGLSWLFIVMINHISLLYYILLKEEIIKDK